MIHTMKTRLVLLAVAALVLVSAATVALASPAAKVTRTAVPGAGLSLELPTSWRRVDAKTAGSIAKESLARENPQLATILSQLDQPGTGLTFFAFDPRGAAQFATNANIVVAAIPAGVTLSVYHQAARRELERVPGRVGKVTSTIVRLPGGSAVSSTVDIALTNRGKRVVARVTQYAFLRPGRSVVLSFTTRKSSFASYRATFKAASRSVRFTG